MSTLPLPSPLDRAIDEIRADLKPKDYAKNEFYKQLLAQKQPKLSQAGRGERDGPQRLQSQISADKLREFMGDLHPGVQRRRDYRVLSRLGPFVGSLQMLMQSCETLFQSTPFGVNIAFSGARILLQISQNLEAYFDTVLDAMEQIGKIIACYEKFAAAYGDPEVQRCLVSSYKRILMFWAKASQTLGHSKIGSTVKMAFKSLAKPLDRQIKEALDGIEKDTRDVQRIAQAVESQLAQNDRAQKRRRAILDWILGGELVDTELPFQSQLKRRHTGTCKWIFEDARFSAWIDEKNSSALWYNAPAGSGKSVLSSAVVSHLVGMGKHVAHTFYSFSDPWHRYTLSGLKSLALQLIIILEKGGQPIPDKVAGIYEKAVRQHVLTLNSLDTAAQVVHELVNLCPEVYIVVDGLDECAEEGQMVSMLSLLLQTPKLGSSKWFFTSRSDHPKIRHIMQQNAATSLVPGHGAISRDIQLYFADTVGASSSLKCQQCVADWVDDCDVSFLYATVIADILSGKDFTCKEEIYDALRKFPQELNQYYMSLLRQLATQPAAKQELARRVFLILTSSAQSLSLDELLNALAVWPGATDHSNSRTPSQKLVEELCMPFVTLDVNNFKGAEGEGGREKPPIIKLYHMTVKDFFLQGLDTLDVKQELRKFFFTPESAAMELGTTCITYLGYKRYAQPLDIKALLDSDLKEHAFLPYAVTFWAQHLDVTEPSPEVDKQVKDLLKSPNFWTCLGVLSHTAKYQFARFNPVPNGYMMRIRHVESTSRTWHESLAGFPLPNWLRTSPPDGGSLDQSFLSFVEEWREVLILDPEGLNSCLPLRQSTGGCCLVPPSEKRRAKVVCLEDACGYKTDGVSEARLADVYLSKKTLWAEVLYQDKEDMGQITRSMAPLFSAKKKAPAPTKHAIPDIGEGLLVSNSINSNPRNSESDKVSLTAWTIDPQTLDVKYTGEESSRRHNAPRSLLQGVVRRADEEWVILSTHVVPAAGRLQSLLVFQMQWMPKRRLERDTESSTPERHDIRNQDSADDDSAEEEDSDYDESASSYDDSASSDEGSEPPRRPQRNHYTNTNYDEDEDEEQEPERTSDSDGDFDHCLIIVPLNGPVHWHPWSSPSTDRALRHLLSCTMHPTLPLLAVTHTPSQLELLHLETWKWRTAHLPEVSDLQSAPGSSIRELRFSPCGIYLHSLFIGFTPTSSSPSSKSLTKPTAITARLTASTFRFDPSATPDGTLVRASPARTAAYTFDNGQELATSGNLPLALTHWADDAVIVALPPLTCQPKIIRVDLADTSNHHVETLNGGSGSAVYFPTSTPRRQPRLLYRRSGEGEERDSKDCLYLALDSDTSASTDCSAKGREKCRLVVLRWKIDPCEWRAWDEEKDGESEEMRKGESLWHALRGSFVESGKSFAVLTRSGLDWTRRAYLSCY